MTATRSAGRPWTRVCLAVFERDGWTCRWCAAGVHRTKDCPRGGCARCAHGDHWPIGLAEGLARGIPRGVLDGLSNVVTACRRCNQARGVRQAAVARRARRLRRTNGVHGPVGISFLTSAAGNPTIAVDPPPARMAGAPTW